MALRASLWVALLMAALGAARAFASSSTSDTCVYTVYVRTGNIIKAGTDANISLALGDAGGEQLIIENVVAWGGLMGDDHDYFERGNLDIFSGRGPCIGSSICSVIVSSDGTGSHHGWYCDYVEVTSTGPHLQCQQHLFRIDQWLATDAPPYQLTATRDECGFPLLANVINGRSSDLPWDIKAGIGIDASPSPQQPRELVALIGMYAMNLGCVDFLLEVRCKT